MVCLNSCVPDLHCKLLDEDFNSQGFRTKELLAIVALALLLAVMESVESPNGMKYLATRCALIREASICLSCIKSDRLWILDEIVTVTILIDTECSFRFINLK